MPLVLPPFLTGLERVNLSKLNEHPLKLRRLLSHGLIHLQREDQQFLVDGASLVGDGWMSVREHPALRTFFSTRDKLLV
jgi:hypothetical protein